MSIAYQLSRCWIDVNEIPGTGEKLYPVGYEKVTLNPVEGKKSNGVGSSAVCSTRVQV
jgi:hypothetical protein